MTTIAARLSAAVLMMGTAWTVISVPASGAATAQVSAESGWRATVRDFSAKHFRNPRGGTHTAFATIYWLVNWLPPITLRLTMMCCLQPHTFMTWPLLHLGRSRTPITRTKLLKLSTRY
jgi:hypothetical protein